MKANDEMLLRLDDSADPGRARVRLRRQGTKLFQGIAFWSVEVLEVLHPSVTREVRIGQSILAQEPKLSPLG